MKYFLWGVILRQKSFCEGGGLVGMDISCNDTKCEILILGGVPLPIRLAWQVRMLKLNHAFLGNNH